LEGLDALALAFHHLEADAHGVAGLEFRNGPAGQQLLDLMLLDRLEQGHVASPVTLSADRRRAAPPGGVPTDPGAARASPSPAALAAIGGSGRDGRRAALPAPRGPAK